MKKDLLFIVTITIIINCQLIAQVAINENGSAPDASAMLDVKSTNKGFLPPRMTEAEREAINSPVPGLIVWCSNCGTSGELQVYNGSDWVNMIGGDASVPPPPPFICGTSTVMDTDGNIYNTVLIDTSCWLLENLTTTKYNDGTDIPLVTDNTGWYNLTTPGYCWFGNDQTTYGSTYGALYNWYAVDMMILCPSGWHTATDAEWSSITTYLGGGTEAGGKLKEAGTTHWNPPNTDATNESGFTALPGGYRDSFGNFYSINNSGYWWTSDEMVSSGVAWNRSLIFNWGGIYRDNNDKKKGFSVRCIKD